MEEVSHDVEPGPVSECQVCNSEDLQLVIDLGHQPLCDSMPTKKGLNEPETSYPLRLYRCTNCSLTQLDYVVDPGEVFHEDYPYRPGITKEVVEHHEQSAKQLVDYYGLDENSLVVDIGSNDGTLLKAFQDRGITVLGIEPTNTAKIAQEKGIPTIQNFFTSRLAEDIADEHGKADLITATNVFAHVNKLGEFVDGIKVLLKEEGIFMSENHYLLDILRRVQYDSIYHEHIRSYSLKSLVHLFELNDFVVTRAKRVKRYGGTLRVFAQKSKDNELGSSVNELLEKEEEYGLYDQETYDEFRARVRESKYDLLKMAIEVNQRGQKFVGKACPGRCSTLLNYVGMSPDMMPYVAEQPTSLKLEKHVPGRGIPVVEDSVLLEDQPDYTVILAWHYFEPIMNDLKQDGLETNFVKPLPEVEVYE